MADQPADRVTIALDREEAERLSDGMASLLCWCRGFIAAGPGDHDRHPIGIEEARELRLKLRSALRAAP